ncbi:MAG: electron transfer flavoprotein subunit beta/FixA family protein [Clostridiales bacterium]|nr:electron transfer flavoprotein subunit beta/FixA family protein [Clostridiales bacterium]
MEILGCFKPVPDLELLSAADWTADSDLQVETAFVRTVWNCFDESGLELMLRAAEDNGAVRLQALTVGPKRNETYLKTLYALGFAQAVRMDCGEDLRFRPAFVAYCIRAYLAEHPEIDAAVLGSQSADGSNGQTALLLAEGLGWPCVTQVTAFSVGTDGAMSVSSMTDEGALTQTITGPVVLSVGNVSGAYLRVPTMKARRQLGRQPVTVLPCPEPPSEGATLCTLTAPETGRAAVPVPGNTLEERTKLFYQRYWKEWVKP